VETRETPATDSLKFTLNLTPGPHIVTVVGRDGAANRGDATVRVMTVGPTAPAEPAGPSDPAPSAPTEPNPGQRPAQLYGGCALSPNLASSAKDTSSPLLLLALGLLGALRRRRQRSGSR